MFSSEWQLPGEGGKRPAPMAIGEGPRQHFTSGEPVPPWEASKRPRLTSEFDQRILGELDQEVIRDRDDTLGEGMVPSDLDGGRRSFKTQLCKFWPLGSCQKGDSCNFAHGEHELLTPAGASLVDGLFSAVKVMKSFKTQLCKFFLIGTCGKGLACTFAHGEHELAGSAGCNGGYNGNSAAMNAGSRFSQPEADVAEEVPRSYKTQLCKFFTLGSCHRGDSCTYAHGFEELVAYGFGGGGGAGSGGAPVSTSTSNLPAAFALPESSSRASSSAPHNSRVYKTVMCRYFPIGKCIKGDQCTFAHDPSELPGGVEAVAGDSASGFRIPAPPPAAIGAPPPALPPPPEAPSSRGPGSKFKTVPCKYFAAGTCQKGPACTFLHDEVPGGWESFNEVITSEESVEDWLMAGGKNGSCGGGWHCGGGKGGCGSGWSQGYKGDGKGWDRPPPWATPDAGRGALPVGRVVPGFMVRQMIGDEAVDSPRAQQNHSDGGGGKGASSASYKTALCRFFGMGQCNKGADCSYAHGEEDLRPRGAGKG